MMKSSLLPYPQCKAARERKRIRERGIKEIRCIYIYIYKLYITHNVIDSERERVCVCGYIDKYIYIYTERVSDR